jgi:ribosomal protein L11 methyltransferase
LKWLEVSIIADGEIAEAAADVFARHAPKGLALEPVDPVPLEGSHRGQIKVRAYLPMDDQLETRRKRIEEGLWHLRQIRPFAEPSFRVIEDEDWAESWKANYRPIPVGARLLIQPSWLAPTETSRSIIYVDPGQAFGSGTHPTTRLSLLALEEHLLSGQTVYDVGCGTGILSIAAARLGAGRVHGVDIDPYSVEAAQENVSRNHLEEIVSIERGSLPELRAASKRHRATPDIVVANILAPVLKDLVKAGLSDLIEPEGKLILSGVLDEQAGELLKRVEQRNLHLQQLFKEADWHTLVLQK